MAHGLGSPPPRGFERVVWWISIGAASVSFLFALIAFCNICTEPYAFFGFLERLYWSAHLVFLHMPKEDLRDAHGWVLILLYIARALAVVTWTATGIAVVARLLGRRIKLRWAVFRGNHILICGFGRLAGPLAQQQLAARRRVVVIDDGHEEGSTSEAGASLVTGNPADSKLLRRAGLHAAKDLFALSDDDERNGAVFRTVDLLNMTRIRAPALKVFVHVSDPQLRGKLQNRRRPEARDRCLATVFSVLEDSARLLLKRCPLDHARIQSNDPRTVQIVVVGFGPIGEAILTRAALSGHFANLKPLRAIVVDLDAERAETSFRTRYPQFYQVVDIAFLQLDADEPSTQSRIAELCSDPAQTVSTVVISIDDAHRALLLASAMRERLDSNVPIRVLIRDDSGLAELLPIQSANTGPASPITVFGLIREGIAAKTWAHDDLDTMAKALHKDYVQKLSEPQRIWPGNPSAAPWDLLSEELRESNRQAADHIPVKLRALGYHVAPKGGMDLAPLAPAFTTDEVETLAKMEHRRWMAERFLAGWIRGPKDTAKRINPYLVEWEELPDDIKQYDRNSVNLIPVLLASIGQEIRQGESSPNSAGPT
jgi:hypothetical protein